ncbi:hypothetical protein H5410_006971 [Solanum commersonii]|uniref:Uncharacterized protein n=1 Tax=Solanum commersonii TaxID=4109 RepID=A0A9J6ABB9_SOLCO|nr:hypothetical protein H5410_006971 [Solanum commersonii]
MRRCEMLTMVDIERGRCRVKKYLGEVLNSFFGLKAVEDRNTNALKVGAACGLLCFYNGFLEKYFDRLLISWRKQRGMT